MTKYIYITVAFTLLLGLMFALEPIGGGSSGRNVFISGNVAYPGNQLITNIRVQLVSAASGSILAENTADAVGGFFIISEVTEPVHVVALADVVGGSNILYGSPGGFWEPEVFDPAQSASFETGVIELQDLAPPSQDEVGTPYTEGGRTIYPLYHYVFVYDWSYSNHLFREGDNLFYTRHVHRHLGETYESILPEPSLWAKVDNLQNGDTWSRVEIMDYSGGMVIFIFRYYEYMMQDDTGAHPVKLLVQVNCHNVMVSKTLTQGQDIQRWWYMNDWAVSRESIAEPDDPSNLMQGQTWQYQSLTPATHPSELVYDHSLLFAEPRMVSLDWQAPAADGIHTWTSYRIYRDDKVFAELPFTQTHWTSSLENGQAYNLTLCATDGTVNSEPAGTVVVSAVSNDDLLAAPSIWNVFPNPVKRGQSVAVQWKEPTPQPSRLSIINLRGQLIRTLQVEPGQTSSVWDGKDADGNQCPSGIYMLKRDMQLGTGYTRKLVLLN